MRPDNPLTECPPRRNGSVTLMAIIALVVLFITVITFNWLGASSHLMLYHTYFNEKILGVMDGLSVIARDQARAQLQDLLSKDIEEETSQGITGGWADLTADVVSKMEELKLLGEDEEGGQPNVLKQEFPNVIEVKARVKRVKAFPDYETVTYKDKVDESLPILKAAGSNEVHGRVEIFINQSKNITLLGQGGPEKRKKKFVLPGRSIRAEYEFKRVRPVPPFVRHFTLFVKNAIEETEFPERYDAEGNFNWARSNLNGRAPLPRGGVLFLKNGGGTYIPPAGGVPADTLDMSNRGYVYLGGPPDKAAFLNLMAGDTAPDAEYSETFHLFRGQTTDFYKVWSTTFSNFIEKSKQQEKGKDAPEGSNTDRGAVMNFLGRIWDGAQAIYKWAKDAVVRAFDLDKLEQNAPASAESYNSPIYYVVRKDYGYAVQWGEKRYERFGFQSGDDDGPAKIVSNSLHLYGSNSNEIYVSSDHDQAKGGNASPTIVLGNVYRRCLSLSGYKQRRRKDDPSTDRKFEVQAGPVEYFKSFNSLMARGQDPTEGDEKKAPIWVWDARVRWNMTTLGEPKASGAYLPISGAALFGRLIPGLAKVWEKDKSNASKLFVESVAPPAEVLEEATKAASPDPNDPDDNDPLLLVGLSPVFVQMHKNGFFSSHGLDTGAGRLFSDVSPYYEEMMRCFSFVAAQADDDKVKEILDENEGLAGRADKETLDDVLKAGKDRWKEALEASWALAPPKEIDANRIKSKNKKYWVPQSGTGPKYYPFSLPDIWSHSSGLPKNFEDYFKSWVSSFSDSNAQSPGDFFDRYFRPLMTNPARSLPYNYSLRFMVTELRDLFTGDADERKEQLLDEFPPELTDGVGYIEEGVNDYMDPSQYSDRGEGLDYLDMPLNDSVLQKVFEARSGEGEGAARLQRGYFFMDDYGEGTTAPKQVSLDAIYNAMARRSFWVYNQGDVKEGTRPLMTWDRARERFMDLQPGSDDATFHLETILGLAGPDVEISDKSAKTLVFSGGGVLFVPGTLTIDMNIKKGSKPLYFVADSIKLGDNCAFVEAGLLAKGSIDLSGGARSGKGLVVYGSVAANEWVRDSFTQSGTRIISFDNSLKDGGYYVATIEPRLRKFEQGKPE